MYWYSFLIFPLLSLVGFYLWRKSNDKEYLWIAALCVIAIPVKLWTFLVNSIPNFSEHIKVISNESAQYFWVIFFILFVLIVIKGVKDKIKSNRSNRDSHD